MKTTKRTSNKKHALVLTDQVKVGINLYRPSYELDVNGKLRVGTVLDNSDKRVKENIKTMEGDLEKIKKLKSVSYYYKDKTAFDTLAVDDVTIKGQRKKRERTDFLAQDFREVLPNMVHEDENGYLCIDYMALIPSLAEALQ